jgi:hypothetical protein
MERAKDRPGPLATAKTWPGSSPDRPEPVADEVESAELLANEARHRLHAEGFDDDRIRVLADRYIAQDLDGDVDTFVRWALEHARTA